MSECRCGEFRTAVRMVELREVVFAYVRRETAVRRSGFSCDTTQPYIFH